MCSRLIPMARTPPILTPQRQVGYLVGGRNIRQGAVRYRGNRIVRRRLIVIFWLLGMLAILDAEMGFLSPCVIDQRTENYATQNQGAEGSCVTLGGIVWRVS